MLQISVTNAEVSRMDKQDEPNSGFKFGSWGATLANRSNTVEDDGIRTSRMGESADDTLPGNARTVRYENDGRDSPDSAETVVIRGDRREEDYERSVNESRTNSPSSGPSGSDTSVRKLERFFDELDVAGMVPNYHSTPVSNIPGRYVNFGGQQKSSGELGGESDSDTSSEKEQSNSATRPTFILSPGDATGQDRKEQEGGIIILLLNTGALVMRERVIMPIFQGHLCMMLGQEPPMKEKEKNSWRLKQGQE